MNDVQIAVLIVSRFILFQLLDTFTNLNYLKLSNKEVVK